MSSKKATIDFRFYEYQDHSAYLSMKLLTAAIEVDIPVTLRVNDAQQALHTLMDPHLSNKTNIPFYLPEDTFTFGYNGTSFSLAHRRADYNPQVGTE